jgi:hypothetical protein
MAFVQRIHDFLTRCGELVMLYGASSCLRGTAYLDYLLYANEGAFWALEFVLSCD